jgi:hypothetical protein
MTTTRRAEFKHHVLEAEHGKPIFQRLIFFSLACSVIDDTEITCFVQTQRLHEFDLVVSASES